MQVQGTAVDSSVACASKFVALKLYCDCKYQHAAWNMHYPSPRLVITKALQGPPLHYPKSTHSSVMAGKTSW